MSKYYNRQWRLPNNENKAKQSNYSMDFDGTQVVSQGAGNFTSFNGVSECSVSLWFKSTTSQGPYKWFFNVPATTTGNHGFGVYASGTGLTSHVYTSSLVEVVTNFSGNQWDGNWHHLVLTYKDGIGLRFYYDSVLQFTNNTMSGTITAGGEELAIGSFSQSAPTAGVISKIDGVSAFNYALSSSQITTLYGSSSTGIGNPMSLSPAPVAYYPLGDQDVFNSSSYLVPNASLKDYVFSFDGSDNIEIDSVGSTISAMTEISISAWIKTTSSAFGYILFAGRGGSGRTGYVGLATTSGTIYAVVGGQPSVSGFSELTTTATVNDGNWHHLAMTFKNSNGTIELYIDGSLDPSSSTTSGLVPNNIIYADIGQRAYNNDFRFNGELSNIQIFNTALSSTDAETLYNNGSPLTSMSGFTSLVGFWKLDASATYDGSNWTIPDDSSNSNDGTSSGMTQANLVQSDLSFTSGYSPYALDFDGADDYVSAGRVLGAENTSTLSVSFWLKIPSTGAKSYLGYFIGSFGAGWLVEADAHSIYFAIGDTGTGYQSFTLPYSGNININTWYHICMVYDGNETGSANILKVYINGTQKTLIGSPSFPASIPTLDATAEFTIGGIKPSAVSGQKTTSNVSVFNSALTSSQVTEIYNEGVPSNLNNHSAYSNLVSWWQLGSNSSFNTNWTVLDEKGSNNGTSANMTESDIVDGVNSYANGVSSGMSDNIVGDAFGSSANSLSVNMDVLDRTEDTPN